MFPAGIVEAIDVFKDGDLSVATCAPGALPRQLSLDRLEEGEEDQKTVWGTVFPTQDGGVIVAVAGSAH